jgi:ubiquinone/menaquinone biosynthesis C-methylase UbiE
MSAPASDATFAGPVPDVYEAQLVPLIFEPYAADLARRVAAGSPGRVLELAAGTGAATRALAALLPADASIVATDLNPPMLDRARRSGTARPVEWRRADALQLPFPDRSFDAVACQFDQHPG